MPPSSKLLRNQVIAAARDGEPAEPRCRHAPPNDFCGGCVFQDRTYATQIAAKHAALRQLWEGIIPAEVLAASQFVQSPDPFTYRTRMDFVTAKDRMGLRRSGKFNYIIDLAECHLIPLAAFDVARAVYERAMQLGLPDYNLRSHEGFLRYITVRRSTEDEVLLVAVTASDGYAEEMEALASFALEQPGVRGLHWLRNEGVADMAFGEAVRHWGAATLTMRSGETLLEIGPKTFFQNNIHLLDALLDDIAAEVGGAGVVADLYGGVGTIALRLARQAGQVVCVESVEESVDLAQANVARNGVANVAVVGADVAPFLAEQPAGSFEVVVADPPRSGLGLEACRELLRLAPRRLVYVSCNPLTQIEDARELLGAYRITALRGYDMFPQTPHLESLAIFDRVAEAA